MKKLLTVCGLFLLAACSNPHVNTTTVNDEPTLAFVGASNSAVVYLNDLMIGNAADYNGDPKTLIVPRGTHMLEIRDNGRTILSEKIFVSDGTTKMIRLSGVK